MCRYVIPDPICQHNIADDGLVSWGSFMQTKHLCVLIHIWTKGEVGAPLNWFKPSSNRSEAVLLLWIFWWFLFLSCVCCAFVRVCSYVPCGHLLGKGWPLGPRCGVLWVCYFPIGILVEVWYLIVSIPDLCTLTYFDGIKIWKMTTKLDVILLTSGPIVNYMEELSQRQLYKQV